MLRSLRSVGAAARLLPASQGPVLVTSRSFGTTVALRDEEQQQPVEKIEDIDSRAEKFYIEHPCSHYQLGVDNVKFNVGEHFISGDPHPHMTLKTAGDDAVTGILNVTPFSKSMFCWFGENGNIGKQSKFAKSFDGIISDPMEADQEVNLFPEPIREGEAPNQALLDYFAWTNQIRDKYIDHLTDNIESYPILMKKFGFLLGKGDRETMYEMISQITTSPIKYMKDEYGFEKPDSGYLPMRQKLYFRNQDGRRSPKIRCDLDQQMKDAGSIRKHIPLYDRYGTEIPLQLASLQRGDIVSVESNMVCQLYDVGGNVGAGLKRNIRSVVRLRGDELGSVGETASSPFKSFSF